MSNMCDSLGNSHEHTDRSGTLCYPRHYKQHHSIRRGEQCTLHTRADGDLLPL